MKRNDSLDFRIGGDTAKGEAATVAGLLLEKRRTGTNGETHLFALKTKGRRPVRPEFTGGNTEIS